MKILAVNIAFRTEDFYKRWRMMTQSFNDVQVTLVGPNYYEYHDFGPTIYFEPKPVTEDNFKVRHIDMRKRTILLKDWFSWEYFRLLQIEKPDFVYLIGYEINLVAFQTELFKRLFSPKLKIGLFTMRGKDMPIQKSHYKYRWNMTKRIFDFVNVHYPRGKQVISEQGRYDGPVYLQTQIGVDKDTFFPDIKRGNQIRKRYNIREDDWVFCSAIRIHEEKGVFDIISACKQIDAPFKYLLMGDGKDMDRAKTYIKSQGLDNKIILTGKIPYGEQVAAHMNASNCLIHVPLTTRNWVDTFPLAVVQGMACALPVICSDSGAMPYQVGTDGLIVPEGDSKKLTEMMIKTINNQTWAKEVGEKMLERVLDCFEIRHLNKCLYQTIKSHLKGIPEKSVHDQVIG